MYLKCSTESETVLAHYHVNAIDVLIFFSNLDDLINKIHLTYFLQTSVYISAF